MSQLNNIPELDSINIPLSGVNLIEAAAGTGKTYNIQNITARLIVENDYPIDTIVVVTFTEAAAKELADRLRSVLEALHEKLQGKVLSSSSEVKRTDELTARFDRLEIPHEVQLKRIQDALMDFDSNRVSTIHGFCRRILTENAFECSTAFRVRLEKNIELYVEKLLKDFCRLNRFSNDQLPGMAEMTPHELNQTVKTILSRSNLQQEFCGQTPPPDRTILINGLNSIITALRSSAPEDILSELYDFQGTLNNVNSLPQQDFLNSCADKLNLLLKDTAVEIDYTNWHSLLKDLQSSFILGKARKKGNNQQIVAGYLETCKLFDLSEKFCKLYDQFALCWKLEACDFVQTRLEEWKLRDNFYGFDDLLQEVARAIRAGQLAGALRSKFNAGIIDEFQDTDPLQYEIFKSIFIDGQRAGTSFFMVGDPRQAIYSFRSGDLATYLTARNECMLNPAGAVYKLSCNFRSSSEMIDAFNLLFEKHNNLFAEPAITLGKTLKPDAPQGSLIKVIQQDKDTTLTQVVPCPMQIHHAPEKKSAQLFEECARRIIDLLNSRGFYLQQDDTTRPVTPGDIAVLAASNDELQIMRDLLVRGNVPVCGERKKGIWSSPEAEELADFMNAILNCSSESTIRAALLSNLAGVKLEDLDLQSSAASEKRILWLLNMKQLNECWHRSGTAAMLRMLFEMDFSGGSETFQSRLSKRIGGSRIITNMIQLGDLLAEAEYYSMLPPRGVLNFLREKISSGSEDDESSEMLDSDQSAVKLMTIHKSKGLQFPIVFIPDIASFYPLKFKGVKVYHRNGRLCCNPDEKIQDVPMLAGCEELQEQLRLIYVAVTRACSGCFISWGANKSKETSAIDWIFRMRNEKNAAAPETPARFLNLFHEPFQRPVPAIPAELLNSCFDLPTLYTTYQAPAVQEELVEPDKIKPASNDFRILSYSSLVLNGKLGDMSAAEHDYDGQDDDSTGSSGPENHTCDRLSGGIWDIPGGAAIGNAWHKILENMDFTLPPDEFMIRKTLGAYGFADPGYETATLKMLQQLLTTVLPCGMKFNELGNIRKLNEFEFLLATPGGIDLTGLLEQVRSYLQSEFSQSYQPEDILSTHGGFFGGFIDMIFEYKNRFYIVDWKSNTLDCRAGNFTGKALKDAMFQATYPMQYLCYLAALMRYLEQRTGRTFDRDLYDKYIGGVYYIFLRGITLGSDHGIFSARPDFETIRQLADSLSGSASTTPGA